MEQLNEHPMIMSYHGIHLIKISDVNDERFVKWLEGKTRPVVEEGTERPDDWAFYADYSQWINSIPIIDGVDYGPRTDT
jgi:hypothetical protein